MDKKSTTTTSCYEKFGRFKVSLTTVDDAEPTLFLVQTNEYGEQQKYMQFNARETLAFRRFFEETK